MAVPLVGCCVPGTYRYERQHLSYEVVFIQGFGQPSYRRPTDGILFRAVSKVCQFLSQTSDLTGTEAGMGGLPVLRHMLKPGNIRLHPFQPQVCLFIVSKSATAN